MKRFQVGHVDIESENNANEINTKTKKNEEDLEIRFNISLWSKME